MKNAHYCNWGEQCDLLRRWFRIMQTRVRVWDNEGATVDRYTVAISRTEKGARVWDIYTMSGDPAHPQGVNMYSHTISAYPIPEARDKRVKVQDLSEEVRRAIEERINN